MKLLARIREPLRLAETATAAAIGLDLIEYGHRFLPFPITLAALVLLVVTIVHLGTSLWFWSVVGLLCGVGLVHAPLFAANHHYLATYLALAFALSMMDRRDSANVIAQNSRWLLVGAMAFATLQKLLSPSYRDGSFLGLLITKGAFFEPLVVHIDAAASLLGRNAVQVAHFFAQAPNHEDTLALTPPPLLELLSSGGSLLIVVFEGVLAIGVALRPRANWLHMALLVFFVALALMRQELVFLSLLIALVITMLCEVPSRWRWGYLLLLLFVVPWALIRQYDR